MTGENNLGLKINCIIQLTAPDITGVFQVELDRETVNNSEKWRKSLSGVKCDWCC